MAEKRTGDTTLRELAPAYEGDPVYGLRAIRRFQGPQADILAQAQLFIAAGNTVSIDPGALPTQPILFVRASHAQDPNQTVDTWERVTELVQEDIRNNPILLGIVGDAWKLNYWYTDAKAKIKNQTTATAFSYADPQQQAFFELLSRGADAYLTRRHVLRRRRIISSQVPAHSSASGVESFYSSAALADEFGLSAAITASITETENSAGDAPPNTAWGWMERMNSSIVTPAYAQTEEVQDWVFAAWSTLLYAYIS